VNGSDADSVTASTPSTDAGSEVALVHHDVARGEGMPTAELTGVLVLRGDGCLLLQSDAVEEYLPLWPPGFTAENDGATTTVFDDRGAPFVETGRSMTLGGGELSVDLARERADDLLPDCDVDRYWLTSW
jgi:hypothetical protein